MTSDGEDFPQNVFINCPFDSKYIKSLRTILFTIIYLGYNPRIASERSDSGESRFTKICELVTESKFSIHDISRLRSSKKSEYYRLNMPFELGVDIGCRLFGNDKVKQKQCIIFEKDKYSYQRALSDLSGFDIKAHNNKPRKIVEELRHWFVENDGIMTDSVTIIWDNFNLFMTDFELTATAKGYEQKDIQAMGIHEFIHFIKAWLSKKER
jgi:hypothetical protein